MATDNELTRLADSANALRPEWAARSVRAYLAAHHRDRAFADLATALAVLATDPTTETPARLGEHGPWWLATRRAQTVPDVGPGRGTPPCARPGHDHEPSHACRLCRAEALAGDPPERDSTSRPIPPPRDWRRDARRALDPFDGEDEPHA